MFNKLYRYILLATLTFTMSCSYSGLEDPGDTFRLLAASKDSYSVVFGYGIYVSVELPSGQIYGRDGFGNKVVVGYYVDSVDNSYTKAIYALGYHEASNTFYNYFGVELIMDENDNQQAVGMELYYNDGEYYLDPSEIKFIEENRATYIKGFNSQDIYSVSADKYMTGTGLSVTTTTDSSALYSIATITDDMDRSIIKGYTLVSGKWRDEEIDNSTPQPSATRKTTGYHSIAPNGDNAMLTYIKHDETVEVYELNPTKKGRTLTGGSGLGSNAVYSTIATNKDRDIFVAYVDKDDKLSMYKKGNGSLDVEASFVDYFGVKIENVSVPIIKIYDNGTVITSYIDNDSKLLKIIVDDFTDSSSPNFVTIKPPTDLKVTSFSVDMIENTLHYIYSTSDSNLAPIGSEISVYENGLWRVIKKYSVYNNLDFVSIGGVSKKELYFMFHFKNEHIECTGNQVYPNCTTVEDNTTDYIGLYGFQSKDGVINADPHIGSFATYNGFAYYLFNSTTGFKIAESVNYGFDPKTPSMEDGLPMVKSSSDIDVFKLVNSNSSSNFDNGLGIMIDSNSDSAR